MIYLVILLLIPIFFVGTVIYVSTLYEFMMQNSLDTVLLLIGAFASLISSFIILKEIGLLDIHDYKIIRFQRKIDGFIGLFSFTLLFLFGIALVVNSTLTTINYPKVIFGIAIILFYSYVLYYYMFKRFIYLFKLESITKVNDKLYILSFENEKQGLQDYYTNTKEGFKKGKSYKVAFSKANNNISKVISEVIEVE